MFVTDPRVKLTFVPSQSPEKGLRPWLDSVQERFASTYIGHFAFTQYVKVVDTLKGVAEFNPDHSKGDDGGDDSPTVGRRLPWMLFIPIVFALRLTRLGLSLMALIMRNPPVSRNDVVGQRLN